MKIFPVDDWIMFEKREIKGSLISLPDKADPIQAGMDPFFVNKVGPEVKKVKVGDQCICVMPRGKVSVNGEDYFFIQEKHVAIIFRKDN